MTERLARRGRIGAEELNDVLNGLFSELIPVAYEDGASLVEYILLIAFIAIIVIVAVKVLGKTVSTQFSSANSNLQ